MAFVMDHRRLEQALRRRTIATRANESLASPPLSGDLEISRLEKRSPPSVGPGARRRDRCPERHHPTVHWPERFRGGCAFGAGPTRTPSRTLPLGVLKLTRPSKPERARF